MHGHGCYLRHCDGRQLLVGAFHSLHGPSVSETSVDCHVSLRNNKGSEVSEKKVRLDTTHSTRRKAKGVQSVMFLRYYLADKGGVVTEYPVKEFKFLITETVLTELPYVAANKYSKAQHSTFSFHSSGSRN
jgi:hypothetical protein